MLNIKKTRTPSVFTEGKLDEIGVALERTPKKSLIRLAFQTGVSVASAHRGVHRLKIKVNLI